MATAAVAAAGEDEEDGDAHEDDEENEEDGKDRGEQVSCAALVRQQMMETSHQSWGCCLAHAFMLKSVFARNASEAARTLNAKRSHWLGGGGQAPRTLKVQCSCPHCAAHKNAANTELSTFVAARALAQGHARER